MNMEERCKEQIHKRESLINIIKMCRKFPSPEVIKEFEQDILLLKYILEGD